MNCSGDFFRLESVTFPVNLAAVDWLEDLSSILHSLFLLSQESLLLVIEHLLEILVFDCCLIEIDFFALLSVKELIAIQNVHNLFVFSNGFGFWFLVGSYEDLVAGTQDVGYFFV